MLCYDTWIARNEKKKMHMNINAIGKDIVQKRHSEHLLYDIGQDVNPNNENVNNKEIHIFCDAAVNKLSKY